MAQMQEEQTPCGSRETVKSPLYTRRCKQGIWNKAKDAMLIVLYEKFPVLWDTTHADHFDEKMRKTAIRTIAMRMDDEFDEDKLEERIKVIRLRFADEMRREEASQASGNRYRSHWDHFKACNFLRSTFQKNPSPQSTAAVPRACAPQSDGSDSESASSNCGVPRTGTRKPVATTMAVSRSGSPASELGNSTPATRRQEDNDDVLARQVTSQVSSRRFIKQEVGGHPDHSQNCRPLTNCSLSWTPAHEERSPLQPPASPRLRPATLFPDHVTSTPQCSLPAKRPCLSINLEETRGEASEAAIPEASIIDETTTNVTSAPLPVGGHLEGSRNCHPFGNCSWSWAPAKQEQSLLQPPALPYQRPATSVPGHVTLTPQCSPPAARPCSPTSLERPPQVEGTQAGASLGASHTGACQPIATASASSNSATTATESGSRVLRVSLDDDAPVDGIMSQVRLLRPIKREPAKESRGEALDTAVPGASSRDNPPTSETRASLSVGGQLEGFQNYQPPANGLWSSTTAYQEHSLLQPLASPHRRPASPHLCHVTSTPQYSLPRKRSQECTPQVDCSRLEPAPASWVASHTGTRQPVAATTTALSRSASADARPRSRAWSITIPGRPLTTRQEDDAVSFQPMASRLLTLKREQAEAGSPSTTAGFASGHTYAPKTDATDRPPRTASTTAVGSSFNAASRGGAEHNLRNPPDLGQLSADETLVCQFIVLAMRRMGRRERELTILRLMDALFNGSRSCDLA